MGVKCFGCGKECKRTWNLSKIAYEFLGHGRLIYLCPTCQNALKKIKLDDEVEKQWKDIVYKIKTIIYNSSKS